MIKKIVFCLILLCCMSSVAFAENPSDNVNETVNNTTGSTFLIDYDWHVDGYDWCATEIYGKIKPTPAPVVDYTDTYTRDIETGKYIPLGEVTKPLPSNMVILFEDTTLGGTFEQLHYRWGATYEDIMFGDGHEHSLVNYTHPFKIMAPTEQTPTEQNIDYTDTYLIDGDTGKFVPLGEVTKPLPENMLSPFHQVSYNGWGLTYEDIMNHNYEPHPLK